jgi:hypothetical protein
LLPIETRIVQSGLVWGTVTPSTRVRNSVWRRRQRRKNNRTNIPARALLILFFSTSNSNFEKLQQQNLGIRNSHRLRCDCTILYITTQKSALIHSCKVPILISLILLFHFHLIKRKMNFRVRVSPILCLQSLYSEIN